MNILSRFESGNWLVNQTCWWCFFKLHLLLLRPFNGLFSRMAQVSRYQKSKTSLDLNEARDDGVLGCSGISWTICKQSAPRCREITTSAPHHSIFTGQMKSFETVETYLVGFVDLERDFADAVSDAAEQPQHSGTGQSRCARRSRKVTVHLEEVHKTGISLQVWVSSHAVDEPSQHTRTCWKRGH